MTPLYEYPLPEDRIIRTHPSIGSEWRETDQRIDDTDLDHFAGGQTDRGSAVRIYTHVTLPRQLWECGTSIKFFGKQLI